MAKATKMEQAPKKEADSSFGAEDDALGKGLPPDWTLEALEERVQGLLDSYLSSADSAVAVKGFKEFAVETPGFFDEVVVCALRTALERSEKQRDMVTDLLTLLYKEQVLDRPSLVRGYAKLICTWQELESGGGGNSAAHLVNMLLQCIRRGCVAEEFLMRLPEGLLAAVLSNGAKGATELEKVKERLHQFKRVMEDVKLLGPPLPGVDKASSVLKDQGSPCRHEFVKRALSASLDWPPPLRRRCLALVAQLVEKGVLAKEDVQWGVLHILGQLEDLTLDCTNTPDITAEHIRSLLSKDLVTNNFVLRCQLLRIGGEAGLKVLDAVLTPAKEALPVTKNSKVAQAIEATRGQPEDEAKESLKEDPEVSKKESEPDSKEEPAQEKEGPQEESKDAKAPPVNGTAPKGGGRLSGGGISLRPGGGMSLRPGGGGISLTGGLNGQTLRPGGGGAVSLTAPVKESSAAGGYPNSKDEGKRSSTAAAPAKKEESDWRRDAAEHQDAKQKTQKGSDRPGSKKGANGKASSKGRNNRDDDDDCESEPPQLEVSENSWAKIQQRRREEAEAAKKGGSDSSDEEIARRMKSILNKLTLEKFDELYKQLTECGITKEEHIRILMQEVFEKATTQHHFVEMYTSLCVHFNDWCSEHLKVGKFKHVLLDQCQESFEANLKDPPKEMSPKKKAAATPEELEDHEEKRQRYRLRVMGNIRFIGQLLVKKMVASKILTACTEALLKEASPSSLEALASLLTIAGKEFDVPTWQHHDNLEKIFKKMGKLTKDKSLDCRTRFLLQDVLDLRACGWMDTKVATKKLEAPRKLGDFGDGKKEAR
mmetsp:Transcript_49681/g.115980  ORF Transcript_49681/g.115980 Transcript_49681/m.115980 type:complete len:824 (-) Transcript_49681:62-2533(-)